MSEVSQSDWETAVMTPFATYWAARTEIASPNREFNRAKVEADTFIEWSMLGAAAGETRYSHSVARNHFSRAGSMTFIANVKVHLKVALALDLLDAISLFWETAVIPNGYFVSVGTPVPLGDDGSWHQVSLSANWLYFTDRPSTLT
ncbi:MAG: hypothetical protein WBG86_06250 [Polyangiales bacterium]